MLAQLERDHVRFVAGVFFAPIKKELASKIILSFVKPAFKS